MKGIVMERKSVVFKFEGELEEVSVETFTQAIMGYSSLLQVTAAKVNPSTKLDVVISGTRRGCFEAQLAAVTTDLQGLVTSAIAATGGVSQVIDMVHSLLELRRFLAEGGAPSKIERGPEQSVVINNKGRMTVNNIVLNVESSDEAARAAKGLFSTLSSNESVEGFSVTDSEGHGFSAGRKELAGLEGAPRCEVGSERVMVFPNESLCVLVPVLMNDSGRKWQLLWNGNRISAAVDDARLYDRLARREWTFGIGDYIVADLEVTQRQAAQGAWENHSYRVASVHDVIASPGVQRLFDPDE